MKKPTDVDVKNEAIRGALLALAVNGAVSPAAVVEEARNNHQSVLHGEFEWDKEVTHEWYLLAQAGAIIRRCKLTIFRENAESKKISVTTTRALQSRPSMRNTNGGYEQIEVIMRDESKRRELLASVLRELNAYRRRYDGLNELRDIWSSIDDAMVQNDLEPTMLSEDSRPAAPAGA